MTPRVVLPLAAALALGTALGCGDSTGPGTEIVVTGTIQPQAVERLEGLGRWLTANGVSIYGTRGGPIPPRDWGVTTQRGDTVFVHVLDWPDRTLALPPLDARIRRAWMLADGAAVPFAQSAAGVALTLPLAAANEPDRVVVLEMTPHPASPAR